MITRGWCLLFLLLIEYLYLVKSITCPKTSKCLCLERYNEITLKCSKGEYELTLTSNDRIRISCMRLREELKLAELPALNMSDGNTLIVKNCLIRESLVDILKKFNMTNIRNLTLEYSTHSNISKSLFTGINQLEKLEIRFEHPTLEYDFLENLSNLHKLRLSANGLTMISWSMEYLHNLDYLDLSLNDITKLPDHAFEKLKKLKTLLLWANNIEQISKNTFICLENLETLKLDNNNIAIIPQDLLINLSALMYISFAKNKITKLHSDTFNMNRNLIKVWINNNEISILGDYLFANFLRLSYVHLNNNELRDIPENIFTNSSNLAHIELQNNRLQHIPEKLFDTLKNLIILNLAHNHLTIIHRLTFIHLINLKSLFLQNNRIMSISEISFWSNSQLQILNLSENKLTSMEASLCHKTVSGLTVLDISRNYLSDITKLRYKNCSKLENMYLQLNKIKNISSMEMLPTFKKVDLSFNNITDIMVKNFIGNFHVNVDLQNNQIESLDFRNVREAINNTKALDKVRGQMLILDINNNPIVCDCRNYYLFDYNNLNTLNLRDVIDIKQNQLFCHNNKTWMVSQVNVSIIYCTTPAKCPENCTCVARPADKALIIDCSFQKLTKYPQLEFSHHDQHLLNQTILILSGNYLTNGPSEYLNYSNVTYLDLSNNKVTSLSWIPPHIKILDLKGNNIVILDDHMVKLLLQAENLEKLVLKDNPWSCSQCRPLEFQQSLITLRMVNFSDIFCKDNETLLLKAIISCGFYSDLHIIIPVILMTLLFCALMLILYYKNKIKIRNYLYRKNICCGLIADVNQDDIKYDVFISYSHNDEQFVLEQLLAKLEMSNFKVCIHIRDWIPGKSIMSQIAESVQNSKSTIVVLSEQFTNSTWGLMEFRMAHTESAIYKRSKVIVLMLGDLNENCLNDEIKSYLKTNTYLKWDDEYFWKKLKRSLPRPSNSHYSQ